MEMERWVDEEGCSVQQGCARWKVGDGGGRRAVVVGGDYRRCHCARSCCVCGVPVWFGVVVMVMASYFGFGVPRGPEYCEYCSRGHGMGEKRRVARGGCVAFPSE